MKRVLTAVILIPVVLLLIFKAPTWAIGIVVAGIGFLSLREYIELVEKYGFGVLKTLTWVVWGLWAVAVVVLPISELEPFSPASWIMLGLVPAFFLFLIGAMRQPEIPKAFPAAVLSFAALPYLLLPLGIIIGLHQLPMRSGWFLLVYLLLVVWAGDIAGLYVGRAFGKHALALRISPKKTWEGTIGSLCGSILVGTLWFVFAAEITSALARAGLVSEYNLFAHRNFGYSSLTTGLVLSLLVNVFAQLGDLAESLLKRGAGVKDSGSILPGHGGMLDRIDALLFAAPVVWYYALFLFSRSFYSH